jgi:MoaA/NifB/PqqE/SkfB family radical SAM enzyme
MHDLGPDLLGVLEGARAFIGPEQVVVDLTNRCNTNCIACWTYSPLLRDRAAPASWRRLELPAQVAERLIDDLALLGTRRVRFTGGGEPMLHPRFYELVRRIKERGMTAEVTTNFIRPDVDRLLAAGVDELSISLWAATPAAYTRTHPNQGPATFPQLERALMRLAEAPGRPRLAILNVINRINFHELEQMYDLAARVRADKVYFTLVDVVEGRTEGLMLTPEERQATLEAVRRVQARAAGPQGGPVLDAVGEFMGRLAGTGAESGFYDRGRVDELPCTIGWTFARVLANGDVVPCCRAVMLPQGNLNRNSFAEIWFSAVYDRFRKNAATLPKSDPIFQPVDCYRMCDNLMHNRLVADRLGALGPAGLAALQARLQEFRSGLARRTAPEKEGP